MLTPSISDWTTAATKLVISAIPRCSAMSRKASRRSFPSWISRITRPKARDNSLSHFSLTFDMAASNPRPASTQIVSRSSASGIALRTLFCRPLILLRIHRSGKKYPRTVKTNTINSLMGNENVFEKRVRTKTMPPKRTAATKCNTMKVEASIRPGFPANSKSLRV